jgi:hypothetical protein
MQSHYSTIVYLFFLVGSLTAVLGCSNNSVTPSEEETTEEDPAPEAAFTVGGSNDDIGKSILQTIDGGMLISGTTRSADIDFSGLSRGNRDVFAFKTTSLGSLSFLYTYGGTNSDWAMDSAEDSNGNIYITGYSRSNDQHFSGQNRGENDLFLIKTTPDGTLVWAKTFGGSNEDYGYALEIVNQQIIIAGATRSSDGDISDKTGDDLDILTLSTNLDGDLLWLQSFGSSGNDEALGIDHDTDDGFVITGSFESSDGLFNNMEVDSFGVFIISLNTEGSIQTLNTFNGSGTDIGQSIIAASDEYIIAGETTSNDGSFESSASIDKNGFVIKLNNRFEPEWQLTEGGNESDEIHSIFEIQENLYAAVGETRSSNIFPDPPMFEGQNAFVFLFNSEGSVLLSRTLGGSRSDIALDGTILTTNEIAISGWTLSNDGPFSGPVKAGRDTYYLKISADNLDLIPFK